MELVEKEIDATATSEVKEEGSTETPVSQNTAVERKPNRAERRAKKFGSPTRCKRKYRK